MEFKIANCAHKARADCLNHSYSTGESKGYKVESQNDQLRESNKQIRENQGIWGGFKIKSGRIFLRVAESNYEHNPHARFLMTVWPEIEPRYHTNYAVSFASVMWLRETLVVRE